MCSGALGLLLVCSTMTRLPAAVSVWPNFGPNRATARMTRRNTSGRFRKRFRYGPVPATARSSRVDDGFASSSACRRCVRRAREWKTAVTNALLSRAAQLSHLHFGSQRSSELAGRNLAARTHGGPQRREVGLRSRVVSPQTVQTRHVAVACVLRRRGNDSGKTPRLGLTCQTHCTALSRAKPSRKAWSLASSAPCQAPGTAAPRGTCRGPSRTCCSVSEHDRVSMSQSWRNKRGKRRVASQSRRAHRTSGSSSAVRRSWSSSSTSKF